MESLNDALKREINSLFFFNNEPYSNNNDEGVWENMGTATNITIT